MVNTSLTSTVKPCIQVGEEVLFSYHVGRSFWGKGRQQDEHAAEGDGRERKARGESVKGGKLRDIMTSHARSVTRAEATRVREVHAEKAARMRMMSIQTGRATMK